jgi:hypothetical protein
MKAKQIILTTLLTVSTLFSFGQSLEEFKLI